MAQIETQNKLQEQRVLISRDLHDNIGAQLTFIISAIENLKYFDPIKETLSHRYESIADFAKQTITELRDTIWAMNVGQITWEQLASRISNYLQNAEKASSIKFEFQVSENLTSEHRLASADGIQVYRILQEGIQNAVKYADPNTISVKVYEQELSLHLEINDDGKGFDESKILPGNGLFNMRKRAEELGGTISIISEKGKGTQIHLIWPTNS